MIEDMQTGMMASSTNQMTSASSQIQKRAPGGTMNTQLEFDRNKNGNIVGATGKQLNRKTGKPHRHNNTSWTNKRELSQSKVGNRRSQGDVSKQSKRRQQAPENLLNFHYMPLRNNHHGHRSSTSNYHRRRNTFNKETFLQANCQFVVNNDEDQYMIHSVDPDVLVEWDAIQLVYLPTQEPQSCPICLYPPTAAKMTRCGHVYCWACILHYLALSDKSWHKCPICHEAVHENDLKSVVPIVQNKFSRNGNITMKLMKRPKNSLNVYPVESLDSSSDGQRFSIWNGNIPSSHSKLSLASSKVVLEKILLKEKIELSAQFTEAVHEQTGEENFIKMALEKLETKIKAVSNNIDPHDQILATDEKMHDEKCNDYGNDSNLAEILAVEDFSEQNAFSDDDAQSTSQERNTCHDGEVEHEIIKETIIHQDHNVDKNMGNIEVITNDVNSLYVTTGSERKERNSESSSSVGSSGFMTNGVSLSATVTSNEFYYFYQAEDGQNIFINSLNARCLIEEYGSLEKSPEKIIGQILDYESFTMTKELRKRYRYLSHLPVSCEFIICELMLRPPYLSKHTIHNFMGEFKKRRTSRLKKLEEQRKHDMKANFELSKEAGYQVQHYEEEFEVQLDLSDLTDFPSNLQQSPPSPPITTEQNIHYDYDEQDGGNSAEGPSFAQMLKTTSSLSRHQQQRQSSSANVWGKPPPEPSVYTRNLTSTNCGDDDEGPDIVAPTLKEMFSAAMVTHTINNNNGTAAETSSVIGKSGKKGKKGKGKLLFATGGQRKY